MNMIVLLETNFTMKLHGRELRQLYAEIGSLACGLLDERPRLKEIYVLIEKELKGEGE